MENLDLKELGLRAINEQLNQLPSDTNQTKWSISNPEGQHAIACGLQAPIEVEINGHTGFYCGGMNKEASITIHGHAGVGVGENMMSGTIHVKGNASQSAGATAHGGLLIIDGDASSRCGISMKGVDIVVGGSVGHMSAFMAQAGTLVICGDAGEALGDSMYEALIFVKGEVESLGVDCIEKPMKAEHLEHLQTLLDKAGRSEKAEEFRRYGSERKLYNFDIDNVDAY